MLNYNDKTSRPGDDESSGLDVEKVILDAQVRRKVAYRLFTALRGFPC